MEKNIKKHRVIVYGLGNEFQSDYEKIKSEFNIVAYTDKKEVDIEGYILPEYIFLCEYDYIYITSGVYYEEIRNEIVKKYSIQQNKILGKKDMWWNNENSRHRNEWVKKQLLKIEEGKILLDAGAGQSPYEPWCKHLKYIAQDFGKYDNVAGNDVVALNPKKWDTSRVNICCDIIDIPLEKETVDVVLCTEVLEHIKNPILAIKEFSRLLKKGGVLILTAPFCSLTHFAPFYFANGFSQYWYQENLKEYGFKIKEMTPNGNYFDYLKQELIRIEYMAKNHCKLEVDIEANVIDETIRPVAELLKKMSFENIDSENILCFGWMVVAEKV